MLGALAGLLLVYLGVNVHIGLTNYDGVVAYALSALAGAAVALLVRYAVRKEFGPIIP
jgi:hypothetical protein